MSLHRHTRAERPFVFCDPHRQSTGSGVRSRGQRRKWHVSARRHSHRHALRLGEAPPARLRRGLDRAPQARCTSSARRVLPAPRGGPRVGVLSDHGPETLDVRRGALPRHRREGNAPSRRAPCCWEHRARCLFARDGARIAPGMDRAPSSPDWNTQVAAVRPRGELCCSSWGVSCSV
jgi:hypothetical protein